VSEAKSDLILLLADIDKRIIKIDRQTAEVENIYRKTFLEGESAGLNIVYSMIKTKFNIP
jgi:hypothetical protein